MLRWITRASIAVGLVALAITIHVVGTATIASHLQTIGPWFALLVAMEATATICDATGVYLMTRGDRAPSYRHVLVAQFAGRAVNSVTPGANVGEALKISLLARECPPQQVIPAVMTVSLGGFIVSMTIVSLGMLVTSLAFAMPRAAEVALLVGGLVCGTIATALALLLRRGMLVDVARAACRLRLLSDARFERWYENLAAIDDRLRAPDPRRRRAFALIITSQLIHRSITAITIFATGFAVGGPQLVAILSAGLVLAWVSNIVPMGIGVSEGGNGVLFAMLGAAPALGVALALARRVNQVIFAVIGFGVLAADRLAHAKSLALPPVTVPVEEKLGA